MRSDQKIPEAFVEVFKDTVDRRIAFQPIFAKLTGSVTAGLLLSQAVYWTKRATSGGWFYKTIKQWEEETALSRHEQETARKTLRRFSFWQEERRGVPAKMYFRVDIAALYEELLSLKEDKRVQSSMPESGKLDSRKAANKKAGKWQTGMPETGNLYKGISEITTETTPKTTTTTPLSPLQTPSCNTVSRRSVEILLSGTILQEADPRRIAQAANSYNRSVEEVEVTIDVLDQQYREGTKPIDDPTALLVSALRNGIVVPEGFTLIRPYQEPVFEEVDTR